MRAADEQVALVGIVLAAIGFGIYLGASWTPDLKQWISAVGPSIVDLVGVVAAVGAGIAAWKAAQRQIKSSELLASRHEVQARDMFKDQLSPILGMIDIAWVKVEQAMEDISESERETVYFALFHLLHQLDETNKGLEGLDDFMSAMNIQDRVAAKTVLHYFTGFVQVLREESQRFDEQSLEGRAPDPMRARFVLTALSHFLEALTRFDVELASKFRDRIKQEVHWTSWAELLSEIKDPKWPYSSDPDAGLALSRAESPKTRRSLSAVKAYICQLLK